MNKTTLVAAFFIAAVLAGIVVRNTVQENFMQEPAGMPLDAPGMGPYDSRSIGVTSGWAPSEPMPILQSAPASSTSDPNSIMFLVGNKVDTDCCPSAFNTDTGCVCLTEQDRSLMMHRGGNRT